MKNPIESTAAIFQMRIVFPIGLMHANVHAKIDRCQDNFEIISIQELRLTFNPFDGRCWLPFV